MIESAAEDRLPLGSSSLEAGVRIGDFRIERRLGAGGMGIVYQARQLSLDRPVALKVLGQALTRSNDVARFQREAQAAARLKHPSIAQVYFIGQDRHLCFLAMELIEGASLRRALDRLGQSTAPETGLDAAVKEELAELPGATAVRFDEPTEALPPPPSNGSLGATAGSSSSDHALAAAEVNPYLSPRAVELRKRPPHVRRACEIVRDAAQALAHAHEHGVIHRDIKPDNLLLDRQGGVHVIDFGVARFFDDQAVTYTGQLVGTPLYMSPEQVTGRGAIDDRTDVYSLGLVLYELLTLRPPIEASNREHLLRTIVTKPLPPVAWRNAAVPADVARVVHRATQKDPDQRYATAADFAADLERYLGGQPVAAPPYHFRLDEREIIAARPSQAVLAAFAFFIVGLFLFLAGASLAMMSGAMRFGSPPDVQAWTDGPTWTDVVQLTLMAVGVLAVGVLLGRGVLSGRVWAWWLGLVVAALAAVASLSGLVLMATTILGILAGESGFLDESMLQHELLAFILLWAIPLGTGLVLGITALWGLLCEATRQWYRFARAIRDEHRQLREQLAE